MLANRHMHGKKLQLRITLSARNKLRLAAAATDRSVSEFVLESALVHAEEVLANRRNFVLEATQWKAFIAALDAPARPLPRLERLFKEPGFFDVAPNQ